MFVPASDWLAEGGNSISAQGMIFKVRRAWKDIDIPISAIFESPTLEAFAAEIDRAQDPTGLRLDAGTIQTYGNCVKDNPYAVDARNLVAQLPLTIPSATEQNSSSCKVFLVTGATGFLGTYIVNFCLKMGHRVIAHVRATDATSAFLRLETSAKAYGLWNEDWKSHLEAVVGDISKTRLGLSKDDWHRVAVEVDTIIHNGAQVNWMRPYWNLRPSNVLSTMDCIALCAEGKAKRLTFISSTSVLDSDHYIELSQKEIAARRQGVREDDDLEGNSKGLATGYGQSKWASEYVVRAAGRRGLVGAIVRPGYITGDPKSGVSISDDFLVRLWKGCLQVQAYPDIANTLNQVPVTQVSRVVVAASIHPPVTPLGVAQITSHPRLTMNGWTGALESYGYPVSKVAYAEWSSRVKQYVDDSSKEEHALLPLLDFATGNLPANSIAPELDDTNTMATLQAYQEEAHITGDKCVTIEAIGAYLAYLVAIRFLPRPSGNGKLALPSCILSAERQEALARVVGRGSKT